jgi:hypothetical protein
LNNLVGSARSSYVGRKEKEHKMAKHQFPPWQDDKARSGDCFGTLVSEQAPLLIDTSALSVLLARSVASLHRDDAAGRLPSAFRIGGSKKWRYADIVAWVEMGCPSRADFDAVRSNHR